MCVRVPNPLAGITNKSAAAYLGRIARQSQQSVVGKSTVKSNPYPLSVCATILDMRRNAEVYPTLQLEAVCEFVLLNETK